MAGTISNIINTVFRTEGADRTERNTNRVGRAQTRLGQASASAGRQFSSQSAGLGGLVSAYAGAAATTFALQAAFDALARSARAAQTLEGLKNLATASGESSQILLDNIREITKNQLTLTEAAQNINLSLSAGFDQTQIEGLADVALKASRALGRDLNDAYNRVVKGSAKLETELLDELGIYTKIDPATRAYAAAIGKTRLELTEFERRQAFVNSVIEEGQRKYAAINTTVPTSAEKIEAFGTKITDLSTKIGILLADSLAPLADFLTNNLAGSLAAVSAILALVAKTSVGVATTAVQKLGERISTASETISSSIIRNVRDFRNLSGAAQEAGQSINIQTRGINREQQSQLRTIREISQERALNREELRRGISILESRRVNLQRTREETARNIVQLREQRTALNASGAATTAVNAQLAQLQNRLANTSSLLRTTTTQINTFNAALSTTGVRLAAIAAGIISLGGAALTGIVAVGARLLSLASGVLGFVTIAGLLGSAIASVSGKQDEFNSLLAKGSALLKGFFNPDSIESTEQAFVDLAATSLKGLEEIDSELRGIDEFKIKSKVLGVEVELAKSKEDLVKEVGDALEEVAKDAAPRFTEAFLQTAESNIGSAIGGVLGFAASSLVPIPGARVLGTAIGASIGAGIGAGIAGSELEPLAQDRISELAAVLGDPSLETELNKNEQLSKAVKLLDDQIGVAADLSLEGRKYLQTQIEIARALQDSTSTIIQLQQAADVLGFSATQVEQRFKVASDEIGNAILTAKNFDITINLQNERELLSRIDNIRDVIKNTSEAGTTQSRQRGVSFTKQIGITDETRVLLTSVNQDLLSFANTNQTVNKEILRGANLLIDFADAADRGGLSLESITQKQAGLQKVLRRGGEEYSNALEKQEEINERLSGVFKEAGTGPLTEDTQTIVNQLVEELANQSTAVEEARDNLTNLRRGSENFFDNVLSLVKTQLEVEKQLTDNFKQQLSFKKNEIGLFTKSGKIATSDLDREIARVQFLNDTREEGLSVLEQRTAFEEKAREIAGDNVFLATELASLQGKSGKERLDQLVNIKELTEQQASALESIGILTAEQVLLASNSEKAYEAALGSVLEFINRVNSEIENLEKQLKAIDSAITEFTIKDRIVKIKLEGELRNLNFEAIESRLKNDINSLEQQAELIESLAGSDGIASIDSIVSGVQNSLAPALRAAGTAFATATGQELDSQFTRVSLPEGLQDIGKAEGAKKVADIQQQILAKQIELETNRFNQANANIEQQRAILVEEFALFNAQEEATAAAAVAEIERNKALIQGLGELYSNLLTGIGQVNQELVKALVLVFNGAASSISSALGELGGDPSKIATPTISTDTKAVANLAYSLERFDAASGKLIAKTQELSESRIQAEVENFATRQDLLDRQQEAERLAFEDNIERIKTEGVIKAIEGEKAIKSAQDSGKASGGSSTEEELTTFEERVKSMFMSIFNGIQSSLETALTGVKDFILFGEGNLRDVFVNLLRSIGDTILEQGFIKPISENLAGSIFGAITGIQGGKEGIEDAFKQAKVEVGTGALRVRDISQGPGFNIPGGSKSKVADAAAEEVAEGGFLGGLFDKIKSGFTGLFGEGGFLSNLLNSFGGIASSVFKGIFSFITSIFGGGLASGGAVHRAAGGAIPQFASGGGLRDRVPALLEPGEFVLRRAAASKIGMSNLQQMNATGQTASSAPVINIVNEGTAKTAETSQPRFDGEKYVIDIVTRDLQNNGPIRRSLRGGL